VEPVGTDVTGGALFDVTQRQHRDLDCECGKIEVAAVDYRKYFTSRRQDDDKAQVLSVTWCASSYSVLPVSD